MSPSIIFGSLPISWVKQKASLNASTSTCSGDETKVNLHTLATTNCHSESRTTTPPPPTPLCKLKAPSTLSLITPMGGCYHFAWALESKGLGTTCCSLKSMRRRIAPSTTSLGLRRLPVHTIVFLSFQRLHSSINKSSMLVMFPSINIFSSQLLRSHMSWSCQFTHKGLLSQISEVKRHTSSTWCKDSIDAPHMTHPPNSPATSLLINHSMVRTIWRSTLQIKTLILGGTHTYQRRPQALVETP